jgi:hypothetical protein
MITYFITALIMYVMLIWLDKLSDKEAFVTENDKLLRVGLSIIWPITLLILLVMYGNKKK